MKRYILYFIGLNLIALGIVTNITTGLGVAALSSSIYATSEIFHLSLGMASILWYILFVIIQCIIMRGITREIILEIPLSLLFGYLMDFYDMIIVIQPSSIFMSSIILFIAISAISIGVYSTSQTNLVLNPGDGIVKTISTAYNQPFYNVKNYFDISMIICSITLSFVTRHPIMGIGIGTVISAILIGRFIKIWHSLLNPLLFPQIENKQIKKYGLYTIFFFKCFNLT